MHPHFCECDDCLNRGGGETLESLQLRGPRTDSPSQRHRVQRLVTQRRRQAKLKAQTNV